MKRLTKQEREDIQKSKVKQLARLFKKRNKIMGIDLGTQITGIYSGEVGSIILTPKSKDRNARVYEINTSINNILRDMSDAEHLVAFIEDYSFGLRDSSLAQLAEFAGVIKNILYVFGIPYLLVAPMTLKKFVLGPGRAESKKGHKAQIMVEVLDRWGIKFDDDNACDAYCLYKFGLSLKGFINVPERYSKQKWIEKMFLDFIVSRG